MTFQTAKEPSQQTSNVEEKRYTVFVHTDESINAAPCGLYTWEEAGKRTEELLKEFHSVTWDGIRYYG